MRTTADAVLTTRFQLQIVRAFQAERADTAPRARRLRDLGLRDSQVLQDLVASAVLRKAGPERYFLDEEVWARRRHLPAWQLLLVIVGVLGVVGLGALYLGSR